MRNIVKGPFRPGLFFSLQFLHAGAAYGLWWSWTHGIAPGVLPAAFVLYCIRGLAITVCYHRYYTHGAFKCTVPLQYVMAFCGCLPMQGSIIDWRRDHRQHHAFTDEEGDPHSPEQYDHLPWPLNRIAGFLWSHMVWLYWDTVPPAGYHPSTRQDDDPVVRWQHRWYWYIGIGFGFVLPFLRFGLSGLWWCGFIGVTVFLHVTWCVNSVCHMWGNKPPDLDGSEYTLDESRDNIVVAVLGFGEGFHGRHHRKQNSAYLGHRWYDPDGGKWFLKSLELPGWVWDVQTFPDSYK